jgi:hypothetical protein
MSLLLLIEHVTNIKVLMGYVTFIFHIKPSKIVSLLHLQNTSIQTIPMSNIQCPHMTGGYCQNVQFQTTDF